MIKFIEEKKAHLVTFQTDRIDAYNVETIKKPVLQVIEGQNCRILIDLSGVNHIDSTGFAMFLYIRRMSIANYSILSFCGMSEPVGLLFRTLNLDSIFDIYPTSEEYLKTI